MGWVDTSTTRYSLLSRTMVGYRPQRFRKAYCLGPRDTLPVSIQNPLGYEKTGFSWLWQEVHGST